MKNIKIIIHILILATLGIIAFGPPTQTQAAPSAVEPPQFSCVSVTQIPQSECEALVALYDETNGPNWRDTRGWLRTTTPCSWHGVICENGRTTILNLTGSSSYRNNRFGLQGALPAEIGNLTNLTELNLGANQLSSLPPEIGNLTNLAWLRLDFNELSSLPPEIGNLTNLTNLYLRYNDLSSLPVEIGNLTNLTHLSFYANELSSLPAEIVNLTDLTVLSLYNNQLRSLPAEINNLTNLTYLDLGRNLLSDVSAELKTFLDEKDANWADTQHNLDICANVTEIPQSECEALVALYNFKTNQPSSWLRTITPCNWYYINCEEGHITRLELRYNGLNSLPAEIGNLTNLTTLNLIDNQLSSLPPEIGNLTNLTTLSLYDNELSSLPAEIGNLTNLTTLNLVDNQLSSLPPEIGNLTNLTTLPTWSNELSSLPAEIGNLTNLTELDLRFNQLSSLPAEIGNLTNLTSLSLGSNQLSSLPAEIGNLTNLTELWLSGNDLSSLPAEIGNLTNLTRLDLRLNQLIDVSAELRAFLDQKDRGWSRSQIDPNVCTNVTEIPQRECEAMVALYNFETHQPQDWLETTTPCKWPHITCEEGHITELALSGRELSSLPTEIGNLTNLTSLWLADNQLSSLPAEIGYLANLTTLSLYGNNLSSLPPEVGDLNNLTQLYLSDNQLSNLPAEIGSLTSLTTLDLSFNQLSDLSPKIGNLTNLTSLGLSVNELSSLPAEINNLTNLNLLILSYNRLATPEEGLHSFVTGHDSDWAATQTIPPTEIKATVLDSERIELSWTPIAFQKEGGYYEISVSNGDLYIGHSTTDSKSSETHVIDGLTSEISYDIRIRTYTPADSERPNELWSDYSPLLSVTTLVPNDTLSPLVEDEMEDEVEGEESSESMQFLPLIYR